MMNTPILIEPKALQATLSDSHLLVVDLSKAAAYAQRHIPGAMHMEYSILNGGTQPAPGLLPPEERLAQIAGMLKLEKMSRVVAYDDEGSGCAARLAWTLHYLGYESVQVLNGGLQAWTDEGHPVDDRPVLPDVAATLALASRNPSVLADHTYVLRHLEDASVVLLDARTPEEYAGTKVRAARGGAAEEDQRAPPQVAPRQARGIGRDGGGGDEADQRGRRAPRWELRARRERRASGGSLRSVDTLDERYVSRKV